MAERREDLRAADVDRQFVAERLKAALDEGRLTLGEYDERLQQTYASRTYGDLDRVLSDLPGFAAGKQQQLSPAMPAYPTDRDRREPSGTRGPVPKWLIGIWGAWLVAVSVNVVIWLLVSISSGDAVYFWPMWVAGPWGAVLMATTITTAVAGESGRGRKRDLRRDRDDEQPA